MTIQVNTTITCEITCENAPVQDVLEAIRQAGFNLGDEQNAPVEDVYRELQEKCPDVAARRDLALENTILQRDNGFAMRRIDALSDERNELQTRVDDLTRERDEWAKSANFIECQYNTKHDELVQARKETKQERALKEALVSKVDDLTRERDEVQKRLEESWAVKEKLIAENKNLEAANEAILAGESRPALPEGMRVAKHEEFGRVVVAPKVGYGGGYYAIVLEPKSVSGIEAFWIPPSDLTFLDEEPAPRVFTTVEDFDNAPVGTIVKRDTEEGLQVSVKTDAGVWARVASFVLWSGVLMAERGPWTVAERGTE